MIIFLSFVFINFQLQYFSIYIYIKFHKISSLLIIIFYLSMNNDMNNDSIKNAGLSLSILFSLIINI